VEHVDLDGEAVLYVPSTNSMHILNPTAALIWACIDGTSAIAAVASDISEAFNVDAQRIRDDVTTAVNQFATDGLLIGFEHEVPEAPEDDSEEPNRSPRVLGPPPDS